ncbi:hypothetical protein U2F10_23430 [Leptothoe sp. EHU-05/26/07-4]
MDVLLAVLIWAVIALLYLQYQKCRREGRPFFRASSRRRKHSPIKVSPPQRFDTSPPQRAQQRYSQRSDNTARSQRRKNRSQQLAVAPSGSVRSRTKKDELSGKLLLQLNGLTRNQATSKRLIENLKMRNPHKPLNWCRFSA